MAIKWAGHRPGRGRQAGEAVGEEVGTRTGGSVATLVTGAKRCKEGTQALGGLDIFFGEDESGLSWAIINQLPGRPRGEDPAPFPGLLPTGM